MQVKFSQEFEKDLEKYKKKDPLVLKRFKKQLKLFIFNPRHKSLRIHKLKGKQKNMWSVSITKSIRAVFILNKNIIYFINIGIHSEVYK